ncbi:MAG: hypothetical protein MnENMB40S_01080 [Rhizobiaceae bacterium MnEN-MB40S]|nr:MAG: hypothetical protein MnENMB40S_01080 [Rhizobiaceae bacterium MnEN-MB40S]
MSYETGVTAQSLPVELADGVGAVAISNAAGLSCEIKLSIGEDIYVKFGDGATITEEGLVPVDIGAPCWVRVDVASGSCDVQVLEKRRR